MSLPQQSRSDLAAAEANQRRRALDSKPSPAGLRRDPGRGVVARFRAWLRGLLGR